MSFELARHATRLTAVDASPEMLALNRRRVAADNVRYLQADLFTWTPRARYDVVFFSAWLTHVPPQRFDAFWDLVGACLDEEGRVFVIDELPAEAARERVIADAPVPTVERELQSGARYRAVKAFYEPVTLSKRLAALGWRADIRTIGRRFFYATACRDSSRRCQAV